ncbi:putative Hercynylcysteine sulfoxide lyase [Paratrimastix pyriformis]|uniref:Hercynylcysteine sulfoxide lyase n=1 Tax=Paratrimastix pyriformis TaxID=342808 RepID=A0ABQ8UU57_9EUKA|nr:putative Hercynylcysteine sulfoxide lyase [Paratrimastix pyriformis]|eukprot:GAFH01001489.1.p2 GENE.GAFH01001489.1~~GAFH01001489.1.p2  ORF type:complete len:432 (-),score=169.11 GAFH01001489.1:250-1545(-)
MASTTPVFGHEMRKHFLLAPEYTPLNHGSYGTVPRVVMDAERRYEEECESKPDMWFRSTYRLNLLEVMDRVAQYVNAPKTLGSVVVVENATAAINSVFRGIQFHEGERILHFSVAYPMVKNVIRYVKEREGAVPVEVPVRPPIANDDQVVDAVRTALAEIPAGKLRLAAYDHISSVPALLMPVKKLVTLTRQMHPEALIILDGSHAPGNINIDIADLDPDFYLGNGNKWLFTTKGAAFLYVKKAAQHLIVPQVVSLEFRDVPLPGHAEAVHAAHTTAQAQSLLPVDVPAFEGNFMYIGTKDYCPYITFRDALAFRESVGGDQAIKRYIQELMWQAGQEVARIWHTEVLNPRNMACSMLNVRLPTDDEQVAKDAQLRLYNEHGVFMMVYSWEGHQWTRLSAQVYLELSDFTQAAQHFLAIVKEEEAKRTAAH